MLDYRHYFSHNAMDMNFNYIFGCIFMILIQVSLVDFGKIMFRIPIPEVRIKSSKTFFPFIVSLSAGLLYFQYKYLNIYNENNKSNKKINININYKSFSHRDNQHNIPLMDSIKNNTGNIEFDIHLRNNNLLIGHDEHELKPENTLQSIYLDPISNLINNNEFQYTSKQPINLYLDFKNDGIKSLQLLDKIINENEYKNFITNWDDYNNIKESNPVNLIITGERDTETILNKYKDNKMIRYVSYDGRVTDINNNAISNEYMPMISDDFAKIFPNCNKDNHYTFNDDDKNRLTKYIELCREMKKYLRFWNTPDNIQIWRQMLSCDVNNDTIVINTDNLGMFNRFLAAFEIEGPGI